MKALFRTIGPCLLLSVTIGTSQAQTPVSSAAAAILQQKLDSCVNTYSIPGISVSILLPGNRFWNGASGLSDIYSFEPMDTTLLFYQSSVTKMFVATVVMQMVEEGFFSLDDSIGMYLPPIATVPADTRLRYLLNHRSGLFNFLPDNPASTETWFSYPDSIWTAQSAIETYNQPPTFGQGAGFAYSNTNYLVLGMLVEQVTGQPFATVLRDRILTPYGLDQTFLPHVEQIDGPLVHGWSSFVANNVYDTDVEPILNNCSASMFSTAGGLVSHPKDVARFTRLLFSGQLLADTTLALMRTCTNVNLGNGSNGYGHGTMRYNFIGKQYFGHAGDLSGFTQLTIHQEADSVTLAISINRNFAPRGPIAIAILRALEDALSVGVGEMAADRSTDINAWPNPSAETVHLSLTGGTGGDRNIEVLDGLGRPVHTDRLTHAPYGHTEHTLDLGHLAKGMYLLRVSDHATAHTRRIVLR